MLRWAAIFFIIAIIAGVFGFAGISESAAGIAKFFFFVFVLGFLITFIIGLKIFK